MDNKKFHVHVDAPALEKFALHLEFLANVSEQSAIKLYASYKESLSILETFPRACPTYASKLYPKREFRHRIFSKRFRIVFEILGDAVYIFDIQDCRQDYDKNLI